MNENTPKQPKTEIQKPQPVKDEVKKEPKKEIESRSNTNFFDINYTPWTKPRPDNVYTKYTVGRPGKPEQVVSDPNQSDPPILERTPKERRELKTKLIKQSPFETQKPEIVDEIGLRGSQAKRGGSSYGKLQKNAITSRRILDSIFNGADNFGSLINLNLSQDDNKIQNIALSTMLARMVVRGLVSRYAMKPNVLSEGARQKYTYSLTPYGILEIGINNGWSNEKIAREIRKIESKNKQLKRKTAKLKKQALEKMENTAASKVSEYMNIDSRPNEMIPEDYYA
ncbi:hypothetical protein C4577_07485 [Candidatus Parcubacteria bacterium]|nr:MAG: hypothetical protein C4577_07485 [Candidatus Parcubacteria bacterium]